MSKRTKAAHRKGRQAQIDGKALTDNPYKREDYARAWDDGYQEALDECTEEVHHVVAHEPPVVTQTLHTQTYYYRNPARPCPECQALMCEPPIQHRQAVVAIKSNRWQAFMHCRVCEHKFILPVKYPPHG